MSAPACSDKSVEIRRGIRRRAQGRARRPAEGPKAGGRYIVGPAAGKRATAGLLVRGGAGGPGGFGRGAGAKRTGRPNSALGEGRTCRRAGGGGGARAGGWALSVYQRGRTWVVQVVVGRDPRTGKPRRMQWTFDSRAEAVAFEARKKAEVSDLRRRGVEPSTQPLGEYMRQWLARRREDLRPKTVTEYGYAVERLIVPSLGKVPLADLTPALIQQWQDLLAPTPEARGAAAAAGALRVLRSALSDAERMGLIARNPARLARAARRGRRAREGFTLEEARAILRAAEGERLEPLFRFLLYSGMRAGEALALRWSDVDLEGGMVAVRRALVYVRGRMVEGPPKTKASGRTFALPSPALEALREQRARQAQERLAAGPSWPDHDLVFTARNGSPLNLSNVDADFRRVRARAGVRPLPLHSLRHAAASILLGAGVPVAVAAKMLGHSVEVFSEVYADLLTEATREAARQVDGFLSRVEQPRGDVVPLRRRP
jgi:integrase